MGLDSLSPRTDVEESEGHAKEVLNDFRAGVPAVLDRIRWNHPRFKGLSDEEIRAQPFVLADARLVIARLHYFRDWPDLLRHIETLEGKDPRVQRFEEASDAIVDGDVATLTKLLGDHPDLVHQRATRAHEAPLLHYVAANGVEDYRQRSPENAVQVATMLLDAGAEVDATSEAYGGESTALELVVTSAHPRAKGVQIPLLDLLLERGAAIDGVRAGGSTVMSALHNGCPEAARALAERGARVPDLNAAAGVGRADLVAEMAVGASRAELGEALLHAAATAALGTVGLLVSLGADLETVNEYGGTALGQTLWFAFNDDPGRIPAYADVLEALIAAGGRTDAYPQMSEQIAEVLRRAGRRSGS